MGGVPLEPCKILPTARGFAPALQQGPAEGILHVLAQRHAQVRCGAALRAECLQLASCGRWSWVKGDMTSDRSEFTSIISPAHGTVPEIGLTSEHMGRILLCCIKRSKQNGRTTRKDNRWSMQRLECIVNSVLSGHCLRGTLLLPPIPGDSQSKRRPCSWHSWLQAGNPRQTIKGVECCNVQVKSTQLAQALSSHRCICKPVRLCLCKKSNHSVAWNSMEFLLDSPLHPGNSQETVSLRGQPRYGGRCCHAGFPAGLISQLPRHERHGTA